MFVRCQTANKSYWIKLSDYGLKLRDRLPPLRGARRLTLATAREWRRQGRPQGLLVGSARIRRPILYRVSSANARLNSAAWFASQCHCVVRSSHSALVVCRRRSAHGHGTTSAFFRNAAISYSSIKEPHNKAARIHGALGRARGVTISQLSDLGRWAWAQYRPYRMPATEYALATSNGSSCQQSKTVAPSC